MKSHIKQVDKNSGIKASSKETWGLQTYFEIIENTSPKIKILEDIFIGYDGQLIYIYIYITEKIQMRNVCAKCSRFLVEEHV